MPKKVLVVDDEETLTWGMAKSLSKDSNYYELLIANNGKKALEIIEKENIDLVITDIRMPDFNGLDLLAAIKKRSPKTKVIIMTAYGSDDVQKEASKRGSFKYIEKPFEISDIRDLIFKALEEKKGFVGEVASLQLTDVIQMNCLGRLTLMLLVKRGDSEGKIYFRDGEIIHSETGNLKGEEALYHILTWDTGEFSTVVGVLPEEITINKHWENLIIEAVKRVDDKEFEVKDETLKERIEEINLKEQKVLSQISKEFFTIKGCDKVLIINNKGDLVTYVGSKPSLKDQNVGAILSLGGEKFAKFTELGNFYGLTLELKDKQIALFPFKSFYIFIVFGEKIDFEELIPFIDSIFNKFKET